MFGLQWFSLPLISHHHLQTELAINTHMMISDLHCHALTGQEGAGGHCPLVSAFLFVSHKMLIVP